VKGEIILIYHHTIYEKYSCDTGIAYHGRRPYCPEVKINKSMRGV
jgi:hypothetical protein